MRMMTAAQDILERRARCGPRLARLRLLATPPVDESFPPAMAEDISKEISLILAEAAAATRVVVSASGGGRRHAVAAFLDVRLARLVSAAREVTDAAKAADTGQLHRSVSRFDALTSAMWTVELATSGEVAVVAGRHTAAHARTGAA